ncbi:hypothetical protein Desor_3836 [Desulfosporosinus orientis DSM 765]|uniref:Reductive dehalogenase anchoring protein n=1 Tax=Desulfosporosinus orientis (strain ATCC 19365 / DSM 765 / NCIMB 8382 / VKM B-1628 / Singapore I) TaxID=768706 RepID=G7W9F7_DESOD|nr:hypothetical protein [Desulfosporosinus orientis]AET69294.1 hypothetical protein Desor_3836 [Desulfosporosinus orientis DSM 765]
MILFWILMGTILASGVWYGVLKFKGLSWWQWGLYGVLLLWLAFSLGWIVTSLVEGEVQSAGMGTLIFGGIEIILLIVFFRVGKPFDKVSSKNKGKIVSQ